MDFHKEHSCFLLEFEFGFLFFSHLVHFCMDLLHQKPSLTCNLLVGFGGLYDAS